MKGAAKNMVGGFGARYVKKKYDSSMRPDSLPPRDMGIPDKVTPQTPKKPKVKNISSLQISKDY